MFEEGWNSSVANKVDIWQGRLSKAGFKTAKAKFRQRVVLDWTRERVGVVDNAAVLVRRFDSLEEREEERVPSCHHFSLPLL